MSPIPLGGRAPAVVEKAPPADLRYNASVAIGRDGNGFITSVARTFAGDTYTKTVTRDGNNRITAVSAWVGPT